MLPIMESIAKALKINVNPIRDDKKYPQYRIRTSTVESNNILVNYLNKFPLYSSKRLDYENWRKIVDYFSIGIHKQNINKIVELKSQMNDKRTFFDWTHLLELNKI